MTQARDNRQTQAMQQAMQDILAAECKNADAPWQPKHTWIAHWSSSAGSVRPGGPMTQKCSNASSKLKITWRITQRNINRSSADTQSFVTII